MCTAATYKTKDFYFGRTLDNDFSYGESVVITPRRFPFAFRQAEAPVRHYALMGVAHVSNGYPLYYDAVNENGLCMAGLNFVGNAHYRKAENGKTNLAQFELIPYILGRCKSTEEAAEELSHINITEERFSADFPPAQLHWIIADRARCIVYECTRDGAEIYDNFAGVLTNNPPFDMQLFNLNNYMSLSSRESENRFSPALPLERHSRGTGALGLPGDWSSQSRFVRAAFVRANLLSGESEEESVNAFFHMLDCLSLPRGCCRVGEDGQEITVYASCCNADKGIYYYTAYENHAVTAVYMRAENLEGSRLAEYPIARRERVTYLNARP